MTCSTLSATTPAQLRDLIRGYVDASDQLICISQPGRNRHEHIRESLELSPGK